MGEFAKISDYVEQFDTSQLPSAPSGAQWQPKKAMLWYDQIIDDMLANPGWKIQECATRLGKHPVTIGLVIRSDLFKQRLAARRALFNQELDMRILGRMTRVAELSLDATIKTLEAKGDKIPLALLKDVTESTLDRLGYGPNTAQAPAVNVQVNNNNSNSAPSVSVSRDALAQARQTLTLREQTQLASAPPAIEHSTSPAESGAPAQEAELQEDVSGGDDLDTL